MAGGILTTAQLRDYLGADTDNDEEIILLRESAIESINRETGIDWTGRKAVQTFNEALRVRVWLSYYAVRDGAKNTQFLQDYYTGLIGSLQLTQHEEESTDGA